MGQLNYDALKFWLGVILALTTTISTACGWWIARTRATRSNFEAVNARVTVVHEDSRQIVSSLRRDIDKLEVRMDGLPSHDDLAELHDRITSVDGKLQNIAGGIQGLERTVAMINTHLLEKRS